MEVDTGATVLLMSKKMQQQLFPQNIAGEAHCTPYKLWMHRGNCCSGEDDRTGQAPQIRMWGGIRCMWYKGMVSHALAETGYMYA